MEGSVERSDSGSVIRPPARNPRLRFEFEPAIATLVLAVVEVWAASFPGGDWNLAFGAFLLGMPVAIVWLFLVVDRLVCRAAVGWLRIVFLIVSLPAIVVGTMLVAGTDIPIRARLAASDSALRALATEDPTTLTVGLYDVMDFSRTYLGFEFRTSAAFLGDCGIAYSPAEVPDGSSGISATGHVYRHVDGPWYSWCTGFD